MLGHILFSLGRNQALGRDRLRVKSLHSLNMSDYHLFHYCSNHTVHSTTGSLVLFDKWHNCYICALRVFCQVLWVSLLLWRWEVKLRSSEKKEKILMQQMNSCLNEGCFLGSLHWFPILKFDRERATGDKWVRGNGPPPSQHVTMCGVRQWNSWPSRECLFEGGSLSCYIIRFYCPLDTALHCHNLLIGWHQDQTLVMMISP